MSDERYYEQALNEFESNIDSALNAKAYILAGGDADRQKIEYVKLRVSQLKALESHSKIKKAGSSIKTVVNCASDTISQKIPFKNVLRKVLFIWAGFVFIVAILAYFSGATFGPDWQWTIASAVCSVIFALLIDPKRTIQ